MTLEQPVERPSAYGVAWSGRNPHDCDREHCVDRVRLSAFRHTTAPAAKSTVSGNTAPA